MMMHHSRSFHAKLNKHTESCSINWLKIELTPTIQNTENTYSLHTKTLKDVVVNVHVDLCLVYLHEECKVVSINASKCLHQLNFVKTAC